MFSNTLDNKPIFKNANGISIKDLTQSIFDFKNSLPSSVSVYKVNKAYAMRPDLICKSVYNESDMCELLLKINSISNPFSIDADDIIIVPEKNDLKKIVKKISDINTSDNNIRQAYKFVDESKFPIKSNIVKEFDQREFNETSLLPPNISQENEEGVSIRNNRVYFGENIGKSCVKNGMTVSEYMQTIIKSR